MKTPSYPNKAWRETLDCVSPEPGRGKVSLPVASCRKDTTPRGNPPQTTTVASIGHDELWAAIARARDEVLAAARIPDGWITRETYMASTGLNDRAARIELAALVAAGKMQTRLAKKDGHVVRIWGLTEPCNLPIAHTKSKERP